MLTVASRFASGDHVFSDKWNVHPEPIAIFDGRMDLDVQTTRINMRWMAGVRPVSDPIGRIWVANLSVPSALEFGQVPFGSVGRVPFGSVVDVPKECLSIVGNSVKVRCSSPADAKLIVYLELPIGTRLNLSIPGLPRVTHIVNHSIVVDEGKDAAVELSNFAHLLTLANFATLQTFAASIRPQGGTGRPITRQGLRPNAVDVKTAKSHLIYYEDPGIIGEPEGSTWIVGFEIDESGSVLSIAASGAKPVPEKIRSAVLRWKFMPFLDSHSGLPVPVRLQVTFSVLDAKRPVLSQFSPDAKNYE